MTDASIIALKEVTGIALKNGANSLHMGETGVSNIAKKKDTSIVYHMGAMNLNMKEATVA